jgi:hypothetical protein
MQLKIVSNVEEVGTHMFNQIPTSTTIGWIKGHLRDTLPAHPAPERQRFIYQGRFLEDDGTTLANIFGDSPVRITRSAEELEGRKLTSYRQNNTQSTSYLDPLEHTLRQKHSSHEQRLRLQIRLDRLPPPMQTNHTLAYHIK